MIKQTFLELGLPEITYLIYHRLLESGASPARQLAENLGIPRPTIYDNLKLLIQKGLITEHSEENKKIFQVNDLKILPQLLDIRIEELKEQKKEINQILPDLIKNLKTIEPKIKFYSGVDGIKSVLRELLWYENIDTCAMWPISETVTLLGADYMANLNRRRIRQNISLRTIWPQDKLLDLKEYPFLGVGTRHLRQMRHAPEGMTWSMSYWQYEDKVAFISSKEEMFGFVIHSRDFAELIKAQFEEIWKISKPIKPQPQYTDDFLKTI